MQQTSMYPRLALVEDDPDQREALLAWLRMNDYQVWGAESAEAFYKRAIVAPVDILIIDLGLPGEDGIETIQHIRNSSNMGIIIVSARSSVDERVEGMQSGADLYLVKPVVPEELAVCIETLWQRINQQPAITKKPSTELTDSAREKWLLFTKERRLQAPNGLSAKLTPSELVILELCSGMGGTVKREDLVLALGADPKSFSMHRIDAHLSRLRKKISNTCKLTLPLATLPGLRLEFNGILEVF